MSKHSKRLSVVVKHVTNEEVGHHINMLGVKNQRKMRSSLGGITADFINDISGLTKKKMPKISENDENLQNTDIDFMDSVKSLTPAALFESNEQFAGASVYGFKTPKRSKQMSKLATESATKIRSVKKSSMKENTNPNLDDVSEKMLKTPGKMSVDVNNSKTSEHALKSKTPAKSSGAIPKTPAKLTESAQNTPTRESNRIKKYSVQEMRAQQNAESESSESSESDDEENETIVIAAGGDGGSSRISQSTKRIELPSETELYFDAHKDGRKLATSDRTLARLKIPQMSQERMQTILEDLQVDKTTKTKVQNETSRIERARKDLFKDHKRYFRKWMFYFSNGCNILLYGLGTKRKLVHEFCDKMLSEYDKIIVNGYFPSLIVKSILTSICEIANETIVAVSNQQQAQLDAICRRYSVNDNSEDHIFLIVHNIDGATLRNNKAQNVLSQLAACERIHIIATIDHINASLIWDQSKLSRYNWLWYDVTTYQPYKDETSFEDSLLLLTSGTGIGGSLALSGLVHVARSLTPNARGIFKLLTEFQIEECKNNSVNYIGLPFSDLYQKCREKFLVNSELTLRTQLTEFLDHKLVHIRKGIDGGECLSIPLDNSTLQEYLDQAQ